MALKGSPQTHAVLARSSARTMERVFIIKPPWSFMVPGRPIASKVNGWVDELAERIADFHRPIALARAEILRQYRGARSGLSGG